MENNQYSKLLTLISNSYLIRQSFQGFRIYSSFKRVYCCPYRMFDVTDYRGESDVIYEFDLCLGDDISRTLERIESYQPYYTTLKQSRK